MNDHAITRAKERYDVVLDGHDLSAIRADINGSYDNAPLTVSETRRKT